VQGLQETYALLELRQLAETARGNSNYGIKHSVLQENFLDHLNLQIRASKLLPADVSESLRTSHN
jgi:hypothetical protein